MMESSVDCCCACEPIVGSDDVDDATTTSSFPKINADNGPTKKKEDNSSTTPSSSSYPTGCCCWCRSSSKKNTSGMIDVFVGGRLLLADGGDGSSSEETAADDETTLPRLQHIFSARSMRCFINATRSNLLSHNAERMSLKIVEGISPGGFGTVVKVSSLKTPNNTTKGGAGYNMSNLGDYGGNEQQQEEVEHIMLPMSEEYEGTPEMLALKVIPKKLIRSISRELEAIKGIVDNSPFIQKMLGVYDSGNNVLFLSEIIVGGDLFTHIARGLRFGEDQGRFILAELFLGIQHIHSCNFIHGDIKVTPLSAQKMIFFFFIWWAHIGIPILLWGCFFYILLVAMI
jgi:hypothetical protein